MATFTWDPVTAEYEDVVIDFTVLAAHSGSETFGTAVHPDHDVAVFSIERGTGEVMTELSPMALPIDRDSSDYIAALVSYVARAEELITATVGQIETALQQARPG